LQADAVDWAANARDFAIVTNSLRLQEATSTPAATTADGFTSGAAELEGGD
jgi:hypothetical protein